MVRYLLVVGTILVLGQLLFAIFLIYTNFSQQRADLHQKAVTRANFLSAVSPDNILANNFYPLETLVRQTSEDSDFVYSVIVHVDGRSLTNYLNSADPFVQRVIETVEETTVLNVAEALAVQSEIIEVISPIEVEGLLIGEVRLGYTTTNLNGRLRTSIINTLLTSALLGVVLATVTFLQFNTEINRPLQELATLSAQFARGNLDVRTRTEGNSEIATLQAAFNTMATNIQHNLAELDKLSKVASRTNNLVIICNAKAEIEWVNDAFTRTTGYTLDEVVGKVPGRFLQGPETNRETVAFMRNMLRNQQGFNCEIVNYSKNGRSYWVEIEIQPIFDENNTLTHFIAIETDITEKKLTALKIEKSEALKSGILTTALDAIISINHKGEIIEFNPAAENIFGYKKENILNKKMSDLIIPANLRKQHKDAFQRFLKTRSPHVIGQRVELIAQHADGATFPIEIAITALEHQKQLIFTAHLRDISKQKEDEAQLKSFATAMSEKNIELSKQGDRLRSLLDIATRSNNANDHELDELLKQCRQVLNMEIGLISHIEEDKYKIQKVDAPHHALSTDIQCPYNQTLCYQTLQTESVYSTTEIALAKQTMPDCFQQLNLTAYLGTKITVNGTLYGTLSFLSEKRTEPFTLSEEDFVSLAAQWISVTLERKQSRTSLLNYAQELERSNKELQDFAYIASHDLQEPLRKIQAFGSRVQSKYQDSLDEKGRDYLQRMQVAANRMQTLINELLTYSRVTTNGRPFEQTDLNDILRGVLSDLELRIEQKEATINANHLQQIKADPLQMRQLFQNIIGNALKFTSLDREPTIEIQGERCIDQKDRAFYKITISDNGIGFDEKYAEKIFSIFQRLHGKNEYEGTGVGLAICRKIVERHDGTIIANSQLNVGTTFTILLPDR